MSDVLTIGLINNMPPAGIAMAERQFTNLLTMAARDDLPFQLRWFRLAGARPAYYERLQDLYESELDGLIVTGAEPRAASLPDEPIWQPLTMVADWAAQHTASVIWSCLAAHAAALYLDGVERQAREDKIFGIFKSVKIAEHAILVNTQAAWRVPHSRWNDLPEHELGMHGYEVLVKSEDAGVDLFVKQFGRSLYVFIQTHPEYDLDTLLREYRRDVARFQNAEQQRYPEMPRNYFNGNVAAELKSKCDGYSHNLAVLERAELPEGWAPFAVQLYRNWLSYLLVARRLKAAMPEAAS